MKKQMEREQSTKHFQCPIP